MGGRALTTSHRPRYIAIVFSLLCLVIGGRSWAQEDIVAFGDSITEGNYPFDEKREGGYPSRLQSLLRAAGMTGVKVHNAGNSGESTGMGLSRIDGVINKHQNDTSTFIIMEGTNDVNRVINGEYSVETVVQNLEAMGRKVRAKDMTSIYSTIIPRPNWAKQDSNNAVTYSLVYRLRELTSGGERPLAEPWAIFEAEGGPGFRKYYFCCDVVGHPNAAGFDLLAEHFADKILGDDRLPPLISLFSKSGAGDVLRAGDTLSAVVHESGSGIDNSEVYFTINGRAVKTNVKGSQRRTQLSYKVDNKDVGCAARITVHTGDRADPPNIQNRTMAELATGKGDHLDGDINGDCRVDGFDLSLLGLSFGSVFGEVNYSFLADINNNRKVDGNDLAKLARNFGRSSGS
jgi:lysophospholipase L1-like esterase